MKPYLVAYTAGWGSDHRWRHLALEFFQACKKAAGVPPIPLMAGNAKDAAIVMVETDLSHSELYAAIYDEMRETSDFETSSVNPDRLLVAELTGKAMASNAVVHTAIGMR